MLFAGILARSLLRKASIRELKCRAANLNHFLGIKLNFLDAEEEPEGKFTDTPIEAPPEPTITEPMNIYEGDPATTKPTPADPASTTEPTSVNLSIKDEPSAATINPNKKVEN